MAVQSRIKNWLSLAVVLVSACAPDFSFAQTPAVSVAVDVVDGCLRHDYTAMKQWLAAVSTAIEQGTPEIAAEAQERIRGCMAFEVTFASTLTVRAASGVIQTVTGTGRVMLELSPGLLQDAGFDFASHPEMIRSSVVWSKVAITGGVCTAYQVVPSPPTKFAFWLGVSLGPQPTAALIVVPDGGELHVIRAQCHGHWGLPELAPIFSPAWGAIYSKADDIDDYFKIDIPGAAGRAVFAQHVVQRTEPLPGAQGVVDERTAIVITHAPKVR